ncbi:MAG: tetratricopeptide repeat protein [Phycisphaerales bacterium]
MPRPLTVSPSHRLTVSRQVLACCSAALLLSPPAPAPPADTLDPSGAWRPAPAPADESPDAAIINHAREALADNNPGRALSILDDWIEAHQTGDHPLLARAFLLRGDAHLARGDEFDALYDYEEVCRAYPASPEFLKALEREFDIALAYLGGLRRKWILGLRLTGSEDVGEELLIRIQERLPGSRLGERAMLALGRYYLPDRPRRAAPYRVSAFGQEIHKPPNAFDFRAAADVYEAFLRWYPRSEHITYARKRRIEAIMARYRGPNYDASSLLDARILIEDFQDTDPAGARLSGFDEDLLARFDEAAAAQLLQRARWYLRRADPVSARFTLRRLLQKHPATDAAAAALQMLDERGWTPAAPPPKGEVPASSRAEGATPSTAPSQSPPPPAPSAREAPPPAEARP